jgi:hypothetical protein
MAQTPKNQAAVTAAAVRLLEIKELFLENYWEQEPERDIAIPGVYQLVNLNLPGKYRYRGYHARGFLRSAAEPIHRKYVYVWRADGPTGAGAELLYELRFERGGYHRLTVGAPEPDLDGKRGRPELVLEVGSVDAPRHHYFFLLSRARYTQAMLDALAPAVPRLAARMPDPFWADLRFEGGGALEAVDAYRAGPRLARGETVKGYQVYLLDPLAEAERRAERLGKALDEWYAAVEALGKDDWHSLARRIEALVGNREELSSDVDLTAVRKSIRDAEQPMLEASSRAHRACLALVQWIGMEARPHAEGRLYVHEFPGARGRTQSHPLANAEPRNEFSEGVASWTDRRAIPKPVDEAVRSALARVGEHFYGREWLRVTTAAYARGDRPLADGGTGILFKDAAERGGGAAEDAAGADASVGLADAGRDVGRKGANLPIELMGFILVRVVPDMDEEYLRRVLRPYGVELEAVPGGLRGDARAEAQEKVIAKGRAELGARAPGARLRPRSAQALEAAGAVGSAIMLAIELHNLKKVADAIASQDGGFGEESLAAGAALGDTLGAISKLVELAPKAKLVASKAGGVFAIVGGSCDLILGSTAAWDSYERRGMGAGTAGEGLRALGGALAAAGGVAMLTGAGFLPGAILALLGIAAQLAGSFLVESSDELRIFLRNSRWGRAREADTSLGSDIGYPKPLSGLRDDVIGQHQSVSYLVFPFEARFELSTWSGFELTVKLGRDVDKWLGRAAKWTVDGSVTWGNDSHRTTVRLAFRAFDLVRIDERSITYVARFPQVRIRYREDEFVRVERATIRVCLGTDPKFQATRHLQDEFDVAPLLTSPRTEMAR